MSIRILCVTLAALALGVVAGCKRTPPKAEATIEEGPVLESMLQVGDPKAATQLVKGFHDVEAGSWRWTAGRFSVSLSPPAGAAERGARLILRLTVPDPVIQRLSAVKLSASVDGVALPEETFNKAGQSVYSRDVPPAAVAKRTVIVDFALDKSLPPSASDQRELGLVVSAVGFEAK
jgi:hypothetical protein